MNRNSVKEMNVQLSNVISDIVGETGLKILEAIIAGERDPMRKNSQQAAAQKVAMWAKRPRFASSQENKARTRPLRG